MPTVAEWFLRGIIDHGCEAIFLNPGTDTPPLQEAWAKLKSEGVSVPKLVLCPHEIVAINAAQGYYLASGKPQVAFVHVDVGTCNASGGLNDARASHTPVILCAGTSPVSLDSRVPGSRLKYINWLQDVPDQGAQVRNYVKWQTAVTHATSICTTVDRAFQIANSEPEGPVYLAFPRETLMEELDDPLKPGPGRAVPATLPGLDEATAESLVRRLAEADFPILMTGYGGRTRTHREEFVALAEALSLPIVEYRGRFNAPLEHPLHLGFNSERWVGKSDLIVVIDHDVPFVPADIKLRDDVQVVHMGPDPIQSKLISWGFPATEVHPCNTLAGLRAMNAAAKRVAPQLDGAVRERMEKRRAETAKLHDALLAEQEEGSAKAGANAITPYRVGRALSELCPEAQLYDESVTSTNPLAYSFRPNAEGAFMRNGGSFLGWGLGAPIGAKLADPDKLVVAVCGDGAFMFGVPTAALWTAKRHDVAVLWVIVNNSLYNSVRLASRDSYPDGVMVNQGYVGVDLSDSPSFETIAEACGAWGGRVENPAELIPTLEEALKVVRSGERSAVVNVTIQAAEKPM